MDLFFASFVIISISVFAMSIGVILGGRDIKGSCGGLNTIEGLEDACGACAKPCKKRQARLARLRGLDEAGIR